MKVKFLMNGRLIDDIDAQSVTTAQIAVTAAIRPRF